jgi:hypothetical protein
MQFDKDPSTNVTGRDFIRVTAASNYDAVMRNPVGEYPLRVHFMYLVYITNG